VTARKVYLEKTTASSDYSVVYLLTPDSSKSSYNTQELIWEPTPTVMNTLRLDEYETAVYECGQNNSLFNITAVWSTKRES
jgi:hypothetical protein